MTFDHELKFQRAFRHLQDIDQFVRPWVQGDRHKTRSQVDPKDGYTVFFAAAEQPGEDPLSIRIGEFLHNMRSGLDNLAFTLASAFTDPLPDDLADASEFPIFGDSNKAGQSGVGKARFHRTVTKGPGAGAPARGSGLTKIQGWNPLAQAVVETYQPYHRGHAFDTDPLWVLHDLDRVNKHRLLHTCAAWSGGFLLDPHKSVNARINPGYIRSIGGPITTDTPIARINVGPVDPNFDMHVEIQPSVDIAFAEGTPCVQNQPVYKTLRDIYMHVCGVVVPALSPYL